MWKSLMETSVRSSIELLMDAMRLLEDSRRLGIPGAEYIQQLSEEIREMEQQVVLLLGENAEPGDMGQLFQQVYLEELTVDEFISCLSPEVV